MPLPTRITRRAFAAAGAALAAGFARPPGPKPMRILLRSSWQKINIGDIGHTPGVLRLIEQHLPGAEVIVWASAAHTAETTRHAHEALSEADGGQGRGRLPRARPR